MLSPDEREWVRQAALKQGARHQPLPRLEPLEPWMWNPAIAPAVFDYLFLKQLHIYAD